VGYSNITSSVGSPEIRQKTQFLKLHLDNRIQEHDQIKTAYMDSDEKINPIFFILS